MNDNACVYLENKKAQKNNLLKSFGAVKRNRLTSVALFSALLFSATTAIAEEPYDVDIDGTDAWASSNVSNFLDVDSTISTEASGLRLSVNATVGTVNGLVSYDNSNDNGDEEVYISISSTSGQRAIIQWDVTPSVFPLGINQPSFRFRDVDSETNGNDEGGSAREFCDRLEVRAFDINNNPISASNMTGGTGTPPDTANVISQTGNVMVIEGNRNDVAPQNGEVVVSINANSINRIRVIYEQCETADTDRPGGLGIVNGFDDFSVYTTDLAVNKEWRNAATGDQANVTVSGGTVTTLPSVNSTANSANETDTGTAREVISGVEYSINETFNGGNTFSYINSLSCTGTGDSDVSDGNLTPAASDTSVVCTYLNRLPEADVSVTKTDGELEFAPGRSATYQIVVTNNGPESADGIVVTDTLPQGLASATWSCSTTGGAVCANANGSGNIAETISSLPNGATVTFTVNGTFDTDPSNY